ncbi:MAG: DUF2510 domain-containing protein [Candidatus Dormibacteraceae bacterium]
MSEQEGKPGEASPPPGFYNDGSGNQRWWNGEGWGEQRQGIQVPADMSNRSLSGTALVGYLLALLLPFIGFLVGLALIARKDRHGIGVVLLSTLTFFAYIYAVAH